jgi:hypothetical protein
MCMIMERECLKVTKFHMKRELSVTLCHLKGRGPSQRATATATTKPKTPAFQAWHVTNKGDDSFWTKVGAAWPHRDGKGLSLILSVIPMNGQIVLRQPLPKQ